MNQEKQVRAKRNLLWNSALKKGNNSIKTVKKSWKFIIKF